MIRMEEDIWVIVSQVLVIGWETVNVSRCCLRGSVAFALRGRVTGVSGVSAFA